MSGRKTAIITGVSGGIGTGLAEEFLRVGYNVVGTSREADRKLTASGSLILLEGDVGKQQAAADAVKAAINNFGTIGDLSRFHGWNKHKGVETASIARRP